MDIENKLNYQDLFAREISIYGLENFEQLRSLKVFIKGLRGIGVEICKILIMNGVRDLTIEDRTILSIRDLGSNYFASEQNVNKISRAEAVFEEMKALRPDLEIKINTEEVDRELIKKFDVFMVTDEYNKENLIAWDKICREENIKFVYGGLAGLFGYYFIDFGLNFQTVDVDGDGLDNFDFPIASITREEQALVAYHEELGHDLHDDDMIKIFGVRGMEEINGKTFKIKVISANVILIDCDTREFNTYKYGGKARLVRRSKIINHDSFQKSLENSKDMQFDILESLFEFNSLEKDLSIANQEENIKLLFEIVSKRSYGLKSQENLMELCRSFSAQTSFHASYWAALISKEILKSKGYLIPGQQLNFDIFALSSNKDITRNLENSRYDDYITIFGNEQFNKMKNLKPFVVGCGSLSSEYLKNFALSGIGTGPDGIITITDGHIVSPYNLNKLSLLTASDIGKLKTEALRDRAKKINPDIKITSSLRCLDSSVESEKEFDEKFWNKIDFVLTSVGSHSIRRKIDQISVWNGKPMFDAGVEGFKISSQCVLPDKTMTYGETEDFVPQGCPLCKMKNFPFVIDHCLEFGKYHFDEYFSNASEDLKNYLMDPVGFINKMKKEHGKRYHYLRVRLENVNKMVTLLRNISQDTCIRLAREYFETCFKNHILQLQSELPLETKNSDGQPFWSGLKKYPNPIAFNPEENLHKEFIHSLANVFAEIYGLEPMKDIEYSVKMASNIELPKFQIRKMEVEVDGNAINRREEDEEDEVRLDELLKILSEDPKIGSQLNTRVVKFDTNNSHQINFIITFGLIRGKNYSIEEIPENLARLKVCGSVAAVSSTSSIAAAHNCLEIMKYITVVYKNNFNWKGVTMENQSNLFANLGANMLITSEPKEVIKNFDKEFDIVFCGPTKAIPSGWTIWDKIEIKGPKTVQEIIDEVGKRFNFNVEFLCCQEMPIFPSKRMTKEKLALNLDEALKFLKEEDYEPHKASIRLEISGTAEDGIDVILPPVKYIRESN